MNKYLRDPQYLLFDVKDRVARITLNRPEVLNAIDDDLPRELAAKRRLCRTRRITPSPITAEVAHR